MMRLSDFGSKTATSVIVASVLAASHMTNIAQAAPFPYVNDFSSTGLTNMAGEFTLDTGNGVLNVNHPIDGGTLASVASEAITGIGTSDFVVSTRFTMNEIAGTGNGITAGFGAFSIADTLTGADAPYYLVDWRLGGGGSETQIGSLRILAFGPGGSNTPIAAGGNAGLAVVGETYEMRLTGTFAEGGELDMTFAVFDDAGDPLGEVSGTDFFPINGEFFGLRNRTAGADHILNIDYHHFSVTSPGTESLDGDFNGNGFVDAADYTVWRDGLGGEFTSDQYDVWKNNFGATAGSGNAAVATVPEPAAFGLVLLVLIGMSLFRPRVRTANGS